MKKKVTTLSGIKANKAIGRVFTAAFLVLFGISIALGFRGWLFPSFVVLGISISSLLSLQSFCSKFCPLGAAFFIVRRLPGKVTSLFKASRPVP
ncbi:MAG: hypothetical protein ABIJ86_12480 [Spirochaetota bacterium]